MLHFSEMLFIFLSGATSYLVPARDCLIHSREAIANLWYLQISTHLTHAHLYPEATIYMTRANKNQKSTLQSNFDLTF